MTVYKWEDGRLRECSGAEKSFVLWASACPGDWEAFCEAHGGKSEAEQIGEIARINAANQLYSPMKVSA